MPCESSSSAAADLGSALANLNGALMRLSEVAAARNDSRVCLIVANTTALLSAVLRPEARST
jgi:hypothetical protein